MIDANGFLVGGIRIVPGPADKVYSQANSGDGIACHSVEGDDRVDDIPDRFLSTAREPDGSYTAAAAASCQFINPREDGHQPVQMYAVTKSTWTSGNRAANTRLWSVESEGFAGQQLTRQQEDFMIRLAREWEAENPGKKATRGKHGPRTVWQHNEVWNWATPNAGPTACPSNRYDGFFARLEAREWEEEEVDPRTDDIIRALTGTTGDDAMARLKRWNLKDFDADGDLEESGNSLLDGYEEARTKIAQLEAAGALSPDQVKRLVAAQETYAAALRGVLGRA